MGVKVEEDTSQEGWETWPLLISAASPKEPRGTRLPRPPLRPGIPDGVGAGRYVPNQATLACSRDSRLVGRCAKYPWKGGVGCACSSDGLSLGIGLSKTKQDHTLSSSGHQTSNVKRI